MQTVIQAGAALAKISAVAVINAVLFFAIPVAHAFIERNGPEREIEQAGRRVVAEYVKPKAKPQSAPTVNRVRSVGNSAGQSIRAPLKFNFSPDLALAGAGDGVAMQADEMQAEVFEEGDVDEPVSPRHTPMPSYPDRARELAITGTVTAVFVVGADGAVSAIEDIQAPHPLLAAHVRTAIGEWKYHPAKNKGVPVKQKVRQQLDFQLD